MRLVLEVTSGPHRGKRIEVGVGETVRVGRTRKADVALADNFLSGVHFALECDSKGCRLRDLNSSNGTKLNDELIIEGVLKDGDQVFAGRTDFIVRLEAATKPVVAAEQALPRARSVSLTREKKSGSRKVSKKLAAAEASQPSREFERSVAPVVETKQAPSAPIQSPPVIEKAPSEQIPSEAQASHRSEVQSVAALDSYEAATPEGRLFDILSNQPQQLMALIDAVHNAGALYLLRTPGVEHHSLYRSAQNAALAPYLVRLPARSELLRQMILPDGMELFSRFYDPRFFRAFLENCTAEEAEKFFGPVTSYFMEGERPEILLQFTKSKAGVEKKGHLLSDLA